MATSCTAPYALLHQLYCVDRLTQRAIAARLGVSPATVTRLMNRYGIVREYRPPVHEPAPIPTAQRTVARQFKASGYTLQVAADRLGVDMAMLHRELRGLRIMSAERLAALAKLLAKPK